ncbi:bifunctional metallophosphatase/5'-nucleotidase [Cytobacillus depressus]|uniref:Bifunctional metallophosphatase/5'-nucleotidase n=1 Tax=Cytobacillus depressus TaxID=1602942 RepID=A0A6L3V2W6_9BACI|nr:bifunctional UDP-sugar hydrolase/5'-nucleotidase [Cytobacillus depressus]KAB2333280.1 bifunctional metallophosphatase/5'-nucleotidase [Cytobacillus depressus]
MDNEQSIKITILCTSDIHGTIYPIHYANNEPVEWGFSKIATKIKMEKDRDPHLLLIDNGDLIQGSPLTYHYAQFLREQEQPMVRLLNQLAYDAAVIGNHEFNYGLEFLEQAINESKFPWLSANLLDSISGSPYFGKPYIIKEVKTVKIAILGITTHYIPNWEKAEHIQGIEFSDALQETKKWVSYIKENEKPDVLIVSYHGGFERDLGTGEPTEVLSGENQGFAICQEIEGIDVLLTGHQHRMLTGMINGVEIIQPSFKGQAVGKVTLTLNKEKEIVAKNSDLLLVDDVEADREVLQLAALYEEKTQKWLDTPIGILDHDMLITDPLQVRIQDHPLIEFINYVQMDVAGVEISNTALFDNSSPGFPKNVTMRDIVANYIYPNTLTVLRLTGHDIKAALEQSASYFTIDQAGEIAVNPSFIEPKPQHYNYDMWEGIEYILDISKPIGQRVTKLHFKGEPLHLDSTFDVVMNNYRATGGGNYMMFKDKPVVKEIPMDMSELIANYIRKRKYIQASLNQNWKVIW